MVPIEHNRSFASLTTMKAGGPAKYFVAARTTTEVVDALQYARERELRVLILGGGSNMLVSDNGFDGLIISIEIPGIDLLDENEVSILLKVGAGEKWDEVVRFAVEHDWWGIENLSRIPGRAGALAVQNVGAYGAEASQVVVRVEAYDPLSGRIVHLTNEECGFRYRQSIFNSSEKGRYVILSTDIQLSKIPRPNISYPDLAKRFGGRQPAIGEIRAAVAEIRDKKFPFPEESVSGNAGSFFKNNLLTAEEYQLLEQKFEKNLPEWTHRLRVIREKFPAVGQIKIPTAFLLEACGLREYSEQNAKLNEAQPVVLLNTLGNASAEELLMLAAKVRMLVYEKTGLRLAIEPELVGFSESELHSHGFDDAEIELIRRVGTSF